MPVTPPVAPANTSVCPRCSAALRCAMVAGEAACWCAQLPLTLPIPSEPLPAGGAAASCYCPACLQQIIDEQLLAGHPPPH